jgi:hypothetical protein
VTNATQAGDANQAGDDSLDVTVVEYWSLIQLEVVDPSQNLLGT